MTGLIDDECLFNLIRIGFSEYEARAYLALLGESPVTGYRLAGLAGIPSSVIYEVLAKLATHGAVMVSRRQSGTLYTAVPAGEFLGRLNRERSATIASLKQDLGSLAPRSGDGQTQNVEGYERTVNKAATMIARAKRIVHLALAPSVFPSLQSAAREAIARGVNVVVYATDGIDLPGGRVVITPALGEVDVRMNGRWLILSIDGRETLVGAGARAFWTISPLAVLIIKRYLCINLCVSRVLAREDADSATIG